MICYYSSIDPDLRKMPSILRKFSFSLIVRNKIAKGTGIPVLSSFFVIIYLHMHGYLLRETPFLEAEQEGFDDKPLDYVLITFSYFFLEVFREDAVVTAVILELQPNRSAYSYLLFTYQDEQVFFRIVCSIFQTRKALLTF